MDKVLKQRLIGASILIALAVIFIPMLFDAPEDERGGRELSIELPEPPADRSQVRRLPLDPDQARRVPPESVAETAPAPPEVTEATPDPVAPEREPREVAGSETRPEFEPQDEIVLVEPEPEAPEVTEAEPEPEPAPAAEPARVAETAAPAERVEGWLVQVASFGADATAREMTQRLTSLGHVASIDPLVRGDTTLHRVVTGPYPSREDAERARGQIARTVAGVEPVVRSGSVAASTSPAPADQYAVQLGSFASRSNADRLVAQLDGADFPAFIHEDSSGGRTIWRVRIGPYASRAEAERELAEVAERARLEGLIVSHP